MKTYPYVIIGGGLAGGKACSGIRQVDAKGAIALITKEKHPPYERPPLSKKYLMGKRGLDKVYLRDSVFSNPNAIDLITGMAATRLDPAAHTVSLADGQVLQYGKLLLATGGHAWRLPIPGSDLPGVFTLRTIEDSDGIRGAAGQGKSAVVIGGSYIGCEAASSLAQMGLTVTMVFPEARLLRLTAPEALSTFLRSKFEATGVHILAGSKPARLEGDGRVERVVLEDGTVLKVDLVVMGVGIRLDTDLARSAGLEMGDKGAVIVDEFLRTSAPDVYAAGDIASRYDATFDRRLQVEHWDVARGQGLAVGQNMAGDAKPYTDLPYFFSDILDLSFEVWGNLSSWDRTLLQGSMEEGRYAFYYFDHGRMTGVLTAGRSNEERDVMPVIVRKRPLYNDVADKLRDETVNPASLV